MTANVTYQIKCQEPECQDESKDDDGRQIRNLYIGQSGRSVHARAKEHARGLKKIDPTCSPEQQVLDYQSQIQNKPDRFTMKVKKVC